MGVQPLDTGRDSLDQQHPAATHPVRAVVVEFRKQAKLSEQSRGGGRYSVNDFLVEVSCSPPCLVDMAFRAVAVVIRICEDTFSENTKSALHERWHRIASRILR